MKKTLNRRPAPRASPAFNSMITAAATLTAIETDHAAAKNAVKFGRQSALTVGNPHDSVVMNF